MKALVVAGGGPQIYLIEELTRRNIETVLIDGNENAVAKKYANHFYKVNIFDIDKVVNIAKQEKVDFIITVCADQVLLVVAEVSERLGLPWYIDYETAKNVSDKQLMKRLFIENDIPTTRYVFLKELDLDKISNLRFPLIVKPVDAYSSRGVRKVHNIDEVKKAFDDALDYSRDKGVIIEEFFKGEELSVDLFVTNGVANTLCISRSEKIKDSGKFVIFRGYYSYIKEDTFIKKVTEIANKIARAFKLHNSPMLIQMLYNGKEFNVLEFCARTGGCMKWLMIEEASNVNVIDKVVDLCLGIPVELNIEMSKEHIVNNFIYCKKGVFDHVAGIDSLLKAGVINHYRCLRPQGTIYSGVINSSSDRVAGVMIKASTMESLNDKQVLFNNNTMIIDSNGVDIMRHDLFPAINKYDIK